MAQGRHDLSKVTLLASRIIRGERSQVLSGGVVVALEQPVLLVFLSTIQVTRTRASSGLLSAAVHS